MCYADDLALFVQGGDEGELVGAANHALSRIVEKLSGLSLQIAVEKTEAVLLNTAGLKGEKAMTMSLCGSPLKTSTSIKYLGFWVSQNMSMKRHLTEAAVKGTIYSMTLSRVMPSSGRGPNHNARRLIAGVCTVSYALRCACVGAEPSLQELLPVLAERLQGHYSEGLLWSRKYVDGRGRSNRGDRPSTSAGERALREE